MSLPKVFALLVIGLFLAIGVGAILKKGKTDQIEVTEANASGPLEIQLDREITVADIPVADYTPTTTTATTPTPSTSEIGQKLIPNDSFENLPDANRIAELFNKHDPRLPFVETITYQSRVGWQKGRPAWLSDYASHYQTSRHFIARSLNGKPDYFKQDVADGEKFNVLKPNVNFHLVIDTSRRRLWFYGIDKDTGERILIKTYRVALGRLDSSKETGLLTPLGKFNVGSKIAIYKPKMMGFHNGQKVEMMRVFGTRWVPFEKDIPNPNAKGFGIQGVPWVDNGKGELVQDTSSIGKYETDGCVRLATADMEELFAIIITKPTTIELVRDFHEATLPGTEKPIARN